MTTMTFYQNFLIYKKQGTIFSNIFAVFRDSTAYLKFVPRFSFKVRGQPTLRQIMAFWTALTETHSMGYKILCI